MSARVVHLAVVLLLLAAAPAATQEYPTKVITLIVPFAAGAPTVECGGSFSPARPCRGQG